MDIPHEKQFHFRDGTSVASLEQLKNKIESISYNEFYHHVNAEKNDFANWIRHVLHDDGLADDLQKVTSIVETVEIINDYLHPRPITEPRVDMQSKIENSVLPTVEEKPKFGTFETEKPAHEFHVEKKSDFTIITDDGSKSNFKQDWPEIPVPKEHEPVTRELPKHDLPKSDFAKLIDLPEPTVPPIIAQPEPQPMVQEQPAPPSQHHDDESRMILKDFMYGLVFGLIIGVILGRIISF